MPVLQKEIYEVLGLGYPNTEVKESFQSMHDGASQSLAIWQPWESLPTEPFTNLLKLPSEVGFTTTRVGCDDIKPEGKSQNSILLNNDIIAENEVIKQPIELDNKVNGYQRTNTKTINDKDISSEIIIFDLNGRILYKGKERITPTNIQKFVLEKGVVQNSGIYFVHILNNVGERKTLKLFISN